ncbi:transcriptional regulator [Paenibacillus yonginensis]|uniref:Transcriptional regulator n=1 Tax=Paenibacillus yonginensis TaxID=1462996 RepID=A0A1B1MWG9_9BACL|nr:helix-turn-helix transcriptional regulator [Paenibacillus yonginensis]ANS73532.1 transcriptional regulator [Paenibacillus yonginensis]
MHSIYERIDLLIRMKKMTKKNFCEELGISTGNLGDWKRGKSTPSTNKLIEIAAFFDVSLDWLMLGKGTLNSAVKEQAESYRHYYSRLDEDGRTAQLTPEEEAFIREYIAFTQYRKQRNRSLGDTES